MTMTSNRPEIRVSDYTSWVIDPLKEKAREKARDFAEQVEPGADRGQIVQMSKPWVAIAAVALAAAAARAAMDATGADAQVALGTAVAAFAVAVVLGMQAKRRLLCVKRRTRVYAFLAAAAGWIVAATLIGLTAQMLWFLAAFGIASSLWYWSDNSLGYGWGGSAPMATFAEPERVDVYGPRWEQNLGARGILKGTALSDWESLEMGDRYTLSVVPGTHTLTEIEMLLPRIKSGLGLRRGHQVMVDEHPTLEAPALQLTIIDRSPVVAGVSWPGISAMNEDGTLSIGPYQDGEGVALWKLYSANRIHNGFIAGGTGSGKSRLLENIAMTAAGNELFPTAVWFADGQDGASSPMLMRHADYYAGKPEQIVGMLREAVEVIGVQQDENKALGQQGFTPTVERPGLLIILDECKLVLDRQNNPELYEETQHLVALIATTGNKAGVGIILAGQEATLPTFGGSGQYPSAIRANLQTGNAVLMRTKQAAASNIFGVDPAVIRQLPDGGGYGYVAGREGSRKAIMRGFYDNDEVMARNMDGFTWRSVSELTALDLTVNYRDRKQKADEDLAGARARYEERRRRHAAGDTEVREHQVVVANAVPLSGSIKSLQGGIEKIRAAGFGSLTAGQDRVLQAVRCGFSTREAIQEEAGLSSSSVYRYLNALRSMNLVQSGRHGEWSAVV